MGQASRRARHSPKRLAKKLRWIRQALGLSQNELLRRMGSPEKLSQSNVSGYERGVREPPLLILLEYARMAGVWVDVLINDDLDLPDKLPCSPKHEGIKRETVSRSGKRRPAKR